jgi:hypothetical protein
VNQGESDTILGSKKQKETDAPIRTEKAVEGMPTGRKELEQTGEQGVEVAVAMANGD